MVFVCRRSKKRRGPSFRSSRPDFATTTSRTTTEKAGEEDESSVEVRKVYGGGIVGRVRGGRLTSLSPLEMGANAPSASNSALHSCSTNFDCQSFLTAARRLLPIHFAGSSTSSSLCSSGFFCSAVRVRPVPRKYGGSLRSLQKY